MIVLILIFDCMCLAICGWLLIVGVFYSVSTTHWNRATDAVWAHANATHQREKAAAQKWSRRAGQLAPWWREK